jgi:single-strand DNA-binding protein
MKRGINKVTLVGHVGEDPKVNQINDDVKVARFPLATNEFYIDKEGNEIQKTQWHNIIYGLTTYNLIFFRKIPAS